MAIGASEAEPFWTEFLRHLVRRGLVGVKLIISDTHEGIKAATVRVLSTTWQRCRVHFQRNALAHPTLTGSISRESKVRSQDQTQPDVVSGPWSEQCQPHPA